VQWLAMALTRALGPTTRARRLVEHFGNIEAIFRAPTELPAVYRLAAQALATGKSL
jgi:hypothetical protein